MTVLENQQNLQVRALCQDFQILTKQPTFKLSVCADPQYFTSVVRLLVPGLVLKEYTEDIDFS